MVENSDYLKLRQLSRTIRNVKARKYAAIDAKDNVNSIKERLKEIGFCQDYKKLFEKCKDTLSEKEKQMLHMYYDTNTMMQNETFNNVNEFFQYSESIKKNVKLKPLSTLSIYPF